MCFATVRSVGHYCSYFQGVSLPVPSAPLCSYTGSALKKRYPHVKEKVHFHTKFTYYFHSPSLTSPTPILHRWICIWIQWLRSLAFVYHQRSQVFSALEVDEPRGRRSRGGTKRISVLLLYSAILYCYFFFLHFINSIYNLCTKYKLIWEIVVSYLL